jgi:hypothetical protein
MAGKGSIPGGEGPGPHSPAVRDGTLESAKYDGRSEARRIGRLVELIRKDNRRISQKVIEQVSRVEAIVAEYS